MKAQPTRRRAAALQHQRSHGEQLRSWLQGKAATLEKRRVERAKAKAEAKAEAAESQQPAREVTYFVQHTGPSYAMRRAVARQRRPRLPAEAFRSRRTRRAMERPLRPGTPAGLNEPYYAPVVQLRPGKGASRRLRKELR